MTSYAEQLRHPKWQRKRLEVLQRADFRCERCGDTESMLSVHHSYYEPGRPPWAYPDSSLHCLCERCHEYAGAMMRTMQRQLGRLCLIDIEMVVGYAKGLELKGSVDTSVKVFSLPLASGVADALHVGQREILRAVRGGVLRSEALTGRVPRKASQLLS